MEINTITTSLNFDKQIHVQLLEKNIINEITESSINLSGLTGIMNCSVSKIQEIPVITKQEGEEDKVEFRYDISVFVMHKGYNSKYVMPEGLDELEIKRIKSLTTKSK